MNPVASIFKNAPEQFAKKGQVLVQSGELGNEAFYVKKGCLKSYIMDSKGKEHIYQFAPEDWIISDLEFISNGGKAILTIEAIEDTEFLSIPTNLLTTVTKYDEALVQEVLQKFQKRVYTLQRRVLQLLAQSADERYIDFIKMYPSLHSRIPLKMIASYLGVTPESLSRVRKELVKGK